MNSVPQTSDESSFLQPTGLYNLATAPASARTSFTHVDPIPTPAQPIMQAEPSRDETPAIVNTPSVVPVAEPTILITFLLVTGRRRTMEFEPETTVRRLKELVWNGWPSDWTSESDTPQPPAPSCLRVLHLGKILQDDDTLAKLSLPSHTTPTIVHLSIRSTPPPVEDADTLKKRFNILRRSTEEGSAVVRNEQEETAGCCCVVC